MKTGQAGDAYGDSNIHISNRVGARGLTIENTSKNTGLASCDELLKQMRHFVIFVQKIEASSLTKCGLPCFHIGGSGSDAPSLAVGDTHCAINDKLTIGSYTAQTDPIYVSGSATITVGTVSGVGLCSELVSLKVLNQISCGSLGTGGAAFSIQTPASIKIATFWNNTAKSTNLFGELVVVDGVTKLFGDLGVNGVTD